jgi:acetyltransferase-like isoleucine patch superfamily enzyme
MNHSVVRAIGRPIPLSLKLKLLGQPKPPSTSELMRAGKVSVGRHTYPKVPPVVHYPGDTGNIRIGAFTNIAEGCAIFCGGEHPTEWVTAFPIRIYLNLPGRREDGLPRSKGDVIIGNDVWLGYRSTVLSGVTIGDGAVVGAGAVVSTDVPPYALVTGIPAKVLRFRFSSEQIRDLLKIAWWEWDDSVIRARCADLSSPDIDTFIRKYLDV